MLKSDKTSNPLLQELRDLAARTAATYAIHPQIEAIMVTGSVAKGLSDKASDIDLISFLNSPAPQAFFDAEKRQALASGGGFYGGSPSEGFGVYRYIDGVRVDLGFNLISETEKIIEDVIEHFAVEDLTQQLIIRGIREGVPLHGADYLATWRRQTDVYPDGLVTAMIAKHLKFTPAWILEEMGVARGDHIFLVERFLDNQRRIMNVLYALNRQYAPHKVERLAYLCAQLPLKPDDLYTRFVNIFQRPLAAATADMLALCRETIDLVDRHWPAFDTTAAREWQQRRLTQR